MSIRITTGSIVLTDVAYERSGLQWFLLLLGHISLVGLWMLLAWPLEEVLYVDEWVSYAAFANCAVNFIVAGVVAAWMRRTPLLKSPGKV